MAQLSWMIPQIKEPRDAPPPDAEDLTDAQQIDFLAAVTEAADAAGMEGTHGKSMHLHG
jgi:hypothetical protein